MKAPVPAARRTRRPAPTDAAPIDRIPGAWWAAFIVVALLLAAAPSAFGEYTLTLLVVYALLALSLAFVWGLGGILCFGQAAFYGLGAYTYAVAAINFGESTGAVLLAVGLSGAFALALGAMMFYGRIGDVYLGVITLVATLVLFKFASSTAGAAYAIGSARLGGFNGIPGFPVLNVPGRTDLPVTGMGLYAVAAAALLAAWLLCRWIAITRFGRLLAGIRENELRAELLGYDARAAKTIAFGIGGALAGLAGVLYACWAEIVTPEVFSLGVSAEIIIWVLVGGLGTLAGPMLGAALLGALKGVLGAQQLVDNAVVMGLLLVLVVLFVPQGLLPMLQRGLAACSGGNPQPARRRRTMAGETVVEAVGVAMRFGGVSAVDGVSMRLARNELRCLVGPNGAGKSTFFKCLSGQYRPTEGEIFLAGESIAGLEKHEIARRGVAVKTQMPSLMNALTVHENLWLAARAVRSRTAADVAAKAGALIDSLGLGPIARKPAGVLAHGQRQVVELGVVLAPDPWLVLLDEPAGGLTRDEVDRMAQLVIDLASRATVVVVEHDMNFVRRIAHAVTVFHRGRVLVEGPAAQVLADQRVLDVYLGKHR